jgi:hypothetical protein
MARYRTHLIFDYVDEGYPLTRVAVRQGETLRQTRRSIDLEAERGARRTPSFVVIGAQKCGTTSLYEILMQHPLAIKGGRRETHFFDWRWQHQLTTVDAQLDFYHKFYKTNALAEHPSLFTGESTPSYLLHSDVVLPRLRAVCPWVQLLVMLRDPTARAYSHYQMCIDMQCAPEQKAVRGQSQYHGRSFAQVVADELAELEAAGVAPGCDRDTWNGYLKTRPQGHGGHSLVARGLYALQLEPWLESFGGGGGASTQAAGVVEREATAAACATPFVSGQVMVLNLSDLKGSAATKQSVLDAVFAHVGVPPSDIPDTDAKNTRRYTEPMDAASEESLRAFYQPFNERLYALLGRRYDW